MIRLTRQHPGFQRRRKALAFLALACLIMMVCLTQRIAVIHGLQLKAAVTSSLIQRGYDTETNSGPSPCQLEAHSLLVAQPSLFDGALPRLGILLVIVLWLVSRSAPLEADDDPPFFLNYPAVYERDK